MSDSVRTCLTNYHLIIKAPDSHIAGGCCLFFYFKRECLFYRRGAQMGTLNVALTSCFFLRQLLDRHIGVTGHPLKEG